MRHTKKSKYRTRENIINRLTHSLELKTNGKWGFKVDPQIANKPSSRYDLIWELVPLIRCPTLLVLGDRSEFTSMESAERLKNALTNCESCEIATVIYAGHSVAGDNPQGYYETVNPFLMRNISEQSN